MKTHTAIRLNKNDFDFINSKVNQFGVSRSEIFRLGLRKVTDEDIKELIQHKEVLGI
jgi:hypothetical protein